MHAQRVTFGCALLMLTGCQTIGGEGMPTLTRTGEVKDVIIRENVDPASLTVNAGDEIRWINKRQAVVRVIFLHPMTENLACQRNFGGMLGFGTKRNQYSAKLRPNKTASVCFRESGEVKYVVRAESTDFGGEQNLAGTISIGPEYQARRPASSDPSAQPAAARTDTQRLADELATAQRQIADREASLATLGHERDHALAVQSENNQAAADLSSRLTAAEKDRRQLADELEAAQRQLADRETRFARLESQLSDSLAAQSDKEQAAAEMSARLAAADTDRRRLAEDLAFAEGQIAERDASLADLRNELDRKTRLAHAETKLLTALQPEISKGTVVVQQSDDALTINLASGLLFESGRGDMKAGAMDALRRVGNVLKDFPDQQVHVAGYTDNLAIKGGLHRKFLSNKELSDARANSAAQALREGGLSTNLWAEGHADSNPIASNATARGRAKNRRVEIIVTS